MNVRRNLVIAVLFLACLLFFLERGTYRAIRYSKAGDFATVYAATRCWTHGENPFDRDLLRDQLIRSGAPWALIEEQSRHLALYPVTTLPFVVLISWLPWNIANAVWSGLSLLLFALSLFFLLNDTNLNAANKGIAASACLLFSPTYVGLINGNPSVPSIALTILAIHFALRRQFGLAGILLGITLCIKPQIALCAVCVFLVWRYWRALWVSCCVVLASAALSIPVVSHGGHDWQWWHLERVNMALDLAPGGLSDPRASSAMAHQLLNAQALACLLTGNMQLADAMVWGATAVITALYLYLRRKASKPQPWSDVLFFTVVTLTITYHRYYDGQLLLLAVPLLVDWWKAQKRKIALACGVCLLLIAFPTQSVFFRWLGSAATIRSWAQFVLLRHQPLAVCAIAVIVLLSFRSVRSAREFSHG